MRINLVLSMLLILMLSGCGKHLATSPTILETSSTGTVWELPAEQVREIPADAGKDPEDVVGVIVVPPSDKPTTVRVYERPKTIKKQIKEAVTGTKGSPDYSATSDNKDVKFTATRERGLWPWLAGIGTLLVAGFAARKWLKRFSWITKFLPW